MSKEYLEVCFKRIKNLQVCVDYEKDIVKSVDEILPNSCNKVEEALQRLEAIENVNPSETLELVDSIREYSHSLTMVNYLAMNSDLDTIKQALIKSQEQEKVLEIIKETNNIKVSFYENGSGKHYKLEFDRTRNQTISQEKFELLKRYFK